MTDTPKPNPGSRRTVPILAAAGLAAVVAVVVLLLARSHQDQPGSVAVAPLPPASPGVVSADYVGSRWRLTAVTDRRGTTEIPGSIDAWLELASDGELIASDDVNTISGHFTVTDAGFDVSDTGTTLVGFDGNDPVRVAAVIGIDAVTINSQAVASAASNAPKAQPAHVTVLSADREHLSLQAGGVRLAFVRSGPAGKRGTPLPLISSAPSR